MEPMKIETILNLDSNLDFTDRFNIAPERLHKLKIKIAHVTDEYRYSCMGNTELIESFKGEEYTINEILYIMFILGQFIQKH